jgi:hypothetical protein
MIEILDDAQDLETYYLTAELHQLFKENFQFMV